MRSSECTINGEKYTLCYSASALAEICDKFGGLDNMTEKLTSKDTHLESAEKTAIVCSVAGILINAGARYNKIMGREAKGVDAAALIDIVDIHEISNIVHAIFAALKSAEPTVKLEAPSKNAEATA